MSSEVAELDRAAGLQPTGWTLATLGDMFAVSTPGHWGDEPDSDGNILVLRSTNFRKAGGLVYETAAKRQFDDRKLVQKRLQRGDIILERSGGSPAQPVGRARRFDAEGCYSASNFMQIMRAADQVDDWFACYLLDYIYDQGLTEALQKATTGIRNLDFKAFLDLPVFVPPLDEQRRIAEVLRSVDDAIAANRAALDQVARARSAILHTAFEEPLWEVVPLGELGSWQSGGTPSKDDETKWGGDVPWVCPRDMKTPVIRRTHSMLTRLALGGSCKLAPKGTLMIVVRGMILAKAIPTATTAMDATFNQDMKAFRPNGRALPKFVQLCLQHQERQLLRVVNTATHGTKKLDTDTLLAVSVPLPDLETQQALGDAVSDLDFASVKYGEEHIRLSTMKQALMSDLLSGHVRVPA